MKDIIKKVLESEDVREILLNEGFRGYEFDIDNIPINLTVSVRVKAKARVSKAEWDNPDESMFEKTPIEVEIKYNNNSLETQINQQVTETVADQINRSGKIPYELDEKKLYVGGSSLIGFANIIHYGIK